MGVGVQWQKEGGQAQPAKSGMEVTRLSLLPYPLNPPGSSAKCTADLVRILQWFPTVHEEIHVLHIGGLPKSGPILYSC